LLLLLCCFLSACQLRRRVYAVLLVSLVYWNVSSQTMLHLGMYRWQNAKSRRSGNYSRNVSRTTGSTEVLEAAFFGRMDSVLWVQRGTCLCASSAIRPNISCDYTYSNDTYTGRFPCRTSNMEHEAVSQDRHRHVRSVGLIDRIYNSITSTPNPTGPTFFLSTTPPTMLYPRSVGSGEFRLHVLQ
jgi:hypothetical protein